MTPSRGNAHQGIYTQAEEKFNSLVENRIKEMRKKPTDHVMLKR